MYKSILKDIPENINNDGIWESVFLKLFFILFYFKNVIKIYTTLLKVIFFCLSSY